MIIMDNEDINDEEFLKACEESSKFYAEIEVPMRKNVAKNHVQCITLDDSNVNMDVNARTNPDPGLFSGQEAEGFDMSAGGEWIYPTNYPIREYQKAIVSKALFNNTLVCLPTGLGKTFIAAVVMYNYHRWYPKNIIVFMAHSKPLVAQQVQACCNIMGISKHITAELNGNMLHQNRKIQWEMKKIFFLTPQVFNNDLARGIVKPESIRCIVIDEAHKATGNQAYCQVIHSIKPFSNQFRVLALSATPGDKMNMVQEVVQNLMISHLEIRTEENPDVKPYLHQKKIEVIEVKLDEKIQEFKSKAEHVTENYLRLLANRKVIPQSRSSLSSFTLLLKQKEFNQDNNIPAHERGLILSNFCVSINLFKAIEELQVHGLKSFLSKLFQMLSGEGSKNNVHTRLAKDGDFQSLIQDLENYLGPDKDIAFDPNTSLTRIMDDIDSALPGQATVYSHPKFKVLEEIITKHFNEFKDSTRVIIFCRSRPCTGEICNFLLKFRPLVKPMIFIGQSQTTTGTTGKGFNQATQLAVMKKFRDGSYNTLVATCVAEEGLDIGEVDLIVNFDSTKNSNTQVQRSGRTGRKRDGRVVNLVTEGKEHRDYNESISKAKTMNKKLAGDLKNLPLYANNPRLLPGNVHPVCQEMNLVCSKEIHIEPSSSRKKTKATETESAKGKRQTKRKKKGEQNKNESLMSADSDLPSSQTKTGKYDIRYAMQKAFEKNKASQSSPHNDSSGSLFQTVGCVDLVRDSKRKAKGKVKPKNNFNKPKNLMNKIFAPKEIQVVELDNSKKFDGILYDEDLPRNKLPENVDSLVSFLSEDEAKTIKRFLENNKSIQRSKAKFSKLIDVEKISNYLCPDIEDIDLLNELKRVQDFYLSTDDLNMSEEDLDEMIFDLKRNETSPKALIPFNDCFVTKRRDYTAFRKHVGNDLEATAMDDFLPTVMPDPSPFKGLSALASSTPLKKAGDIEKETRNDDLDALPNLTPVKMIENVEKEINDHELQNQDNSSSNKLSVPDFQFWEDDFFTQEKTANSKENFDNFVRPFSGKISTQFENEKTMITISQAIEMIDAFQTQPNKDMTEENTSEIPKSSSPVLLSQKWKKPRLKKVEFSLLDCPKNIQQKENQQDNVVQFKSLSPVLSCSQKRAQLPLKEPELYLFNSPGEPQIIQKLEEQKEKPAVEEYDSSPLFVCSRRRKTPVKETKFTVSGSPILSQKTKRKSKKSLKFDDFEKSEKINPTEAEIKPFGDIESEEDLFLEAEKELENYNQNRMESSDDKEKNHDILSQLTVAYDVDATRLHVTEFKKFKNNSDEKSLEINADNDRIPSPNDFHGSNKENLTIFDQPYKSEKPPPKTAIVRPFGFEDKDVLSDDSQWLDLKLDKQPKPINKWLNTAEKRDQRKNLLNSNSAPQKSCDKKLENQKKKIFAADFDCFSDDFFDIPDEKVKSASDDSDDCFNYKKKNKLKINDTVDTVNSNKNDDGFEDELSDGALEAIKAVEEFEKSEKVAKVIDREESMPSSSRGVTSKKPKPKPKSDFTLWDSDDSGEFFQPISTKKAKPGEAGPSKKQKGINEAETTFNLTDENSYLDNRLSKPKEPSKKKKKQKNPVSNFDFIELEAVLSDENPASTDEENTSGLDEYDSSFVDEREVLTQAPNVDMTAKYLQSTKSPVNKNAGFKIPKPKKPVNTNIFSQMPETEQDYEHDSFCVDEFLEENDDQEMSALELAELILEKRKKRKKRKRQEESVIDYKKNKHRRILKIESESSDEENIQNKYETKNENRTTDFTDSRKNKPTETAVQKTKRHNTSLNLATNRVSEKAPSRSYNEIVIQKTLQQNTFSNHTTSRVLPRSSSKQPKKQVIFISAKQLASTSEITTALRAKWNVKVIVRSFLKADFIISWKTGINRITLTDFSNGGVQAKGSLKDNTQELRTFFVNPVYIVEDDKNKGLPLTVGSHTTMWSKHTYGTLAKFFQADVKIVFSKNKDDTARIIAMFTKEEYDKGNGIVINGDDIPPRTETKLKFYKALPGMNIANALRICQKFRSVASFVNCCDSPEIIATELNVDKALAIKIYQTLCNVPFT